MRRRNLGLSCPMNPTWYLPNHPKYPRNWPEQWQTNLRKKREESTLKKVDSMVVWFRGDRSSSICRGGRNHGHDEGKREEHTRETQEECFTNALAWKMREAHRILWILATSEAFLKPRVLKVNGLCRDRAQRVLHQSWKEVKQTMRGQIAWKQWFEECQGHTGGDYLLFSECISERQCMWILLLQEQKSWPAPFPSSVPQYKHRATCRKSSSTDTGYLTCYQPATPSSMPVKLPFSVKLTSVPEWKALPRENQQNSYTHTTSLHHTVLQGLSFGWDDDDSYQKLTWVPLVKTHHIQAKDYTLPMREKEPLQITGQKDRAAKIQHQSSHSTHWGPSLNHQALDTTWPLLHEVVIFQSRRHNRLF